jgi:neopullulanase
MIQSMQKLLFLLSFISIRAFAQTDIYPPNWFVGLKDTSLQLIIHQQDIGLNTLSMTIEHPDITVKQFTPSRHKDYVLVELALSPNLKPGSVTFQLKGKKNQKLQYSFSQKEANPTTLEGNDLIYLVMPDRFANGNPKNDVDPTQKEQSHDRSKIYDRHGGDLQGIADHLPYIQNLGATTVWLTPFQENDEPSQSYHGYAITNHYKVDSRYGSLADYKKLTEQAEQQNMKWVLDLVFNHIGDGHWLYTDKPFNAAIHEFDSFTKTNYRANTLMDPYASKQDQHLFTDGWFDRHMPDVNNDNPIIARYMIQNTIWWIETSKADGIRIDTYSYPEQDFMQQWYQSVIAEYPTLSVFGEIWEHAVPLQSYFVPKDKDRMQNMQNVLDFQFCFAIDDAVSKPDGWTEGISKLYYTLSQDYVYTDPYHHVIFTDNHDLDRFYATLNGDFKQWKAAMSILMTMRGIPSIFYGTEILMRNKGEHGAIREDFKGGWKTDSINKFMPEGRTAEENAAWNHIHSLATWRKNNTALTGKMMQFIPEQGIYVYFRYSETQKVMVVYNSNAETKALKLQRFAEMLGRHTTLQNIFTRNSVTIGETLTVPAGEAFIFEVY